MSASGFLRRKRINEYVPTPGVAALPAAARWLSPDTAPFGRALFVLVTDGHAESYSLPFPCVRTDQGWVHADKGSMITVHVVGWRWSGPPPRTTNGKVFF